ncbi:hypothetical protein GOA81_18110 [Sinorhizobium meliloti]|uniref:hypothetical protein n=1 Tax=Rhizobium meliloti TaxID=382 RepID=UPI000D1DA6B3|nr:hypothetical protein [Sinorhizobium meliloti]MDW9506927.1 hypothetical protein [Sinorhizobium meliloti]MDW9798908.1 hypothetical protein [Sinorhizobium meliloti]RMI21346.1 hypothetical protein DA102_002005 [Sinorhizobium meliloti]
MEWEANLFWSIVALLFTAIGGIIGAFINWWHQRHKTLSDNAWADYELRRDIYLELVAGIGCFFAGGNLSARSQWHETARKVRIVGSDEVVTALNAFTQSIKNNTGDAEVRFYDLNLALRRDIRRLRATPPEGTKLKAEAFPIEV